MADSRKEVPIIHIEWTENLDASGKFKSNTELKNMYDKAGITADKEVISYCQGGYRAAHSYVALRLLGFPKVRNYIGSWKEWGDRLDLPMRNRLRKSHFGSARPHALALHGASQRRDRQQSALHPIFWNGPCQAF